jgi:putative polyketide hydroxylase
MERAATVTSVLIVGAGPAGLVAGVALGRCGVDVLVVDKREVGSTLSRALVISTRSMEIIRSWGLEAQVRAGAADVESRAWVTRSLSAAEGTEMPLGYPSAVEAAEVSPTCPAWAPQDHLEPLLADLLRSAPSADLQMGAELERLEQDDDGVHAWLRRASGGVERVDARYVIGADGAHSATRAQIGIAMDGPDDLAEFHRVEFTASLAEIVGERRYGLYVITHPDAGGVLAPRGRGDRWGFSREWTPGQPRLVDATEDHLVELIATATGVDGLRPQIERLSAFSFAAQLAQRYRERRVFLVGDAAHRMTPRGGTGMNTAIHDAYDLGWRLAWVLRGWADTALLDSYEEVRRPVGAHNVQRAGQPDGARRDAEDGLEWDLNGRVPHRWVTTQQGAVSTLDLVTDGLTLFAGPHQPRWRHTDELKTRAPITAHVFDPVDAEALEIPLLGAMLVGPDSRALTSWRDFNDLHAQPLIAPWR